MAWTETIGAKFLPADYWPLVADTITLEANVVSNMSVKLINSYQYHVNQEEDANLDYGGMMVCSDSVTSLTMNPDELSVTLRTLALNTELCDFSAMYDTVSNQLEVQIKSLARKVARIMEYQVINGNNVSPNSKGLKSWVPSGQINDNAGASYTAKALLADLDALVTAVKVRSPSSAFIASPIMIDQIRQAYRLANVFHPDHQLANGFNTITFRGFPFIPSEFVENNDGVVGGNYTGSIYFANLDFGTNGFGLLTHPNFTRAPVIMDMGLFKVVKKMGSTKAAETFQGQSAFAFALGSTKAAARLKGVPILDGALQPIVLAS